MPKLLHRYYGSGHFHFITSSCYHRRPLLGTARRRDLFLKILEEVRGRVAHISFYQTAKKQIPWGAPYLAVFEMWGPRHTKSKKYSFHEF